MNDHQFPKWIRFAAFLVVTVTISGAVIGYVDPGPVTGMLLPAGLVSWWLLSLEIGRRMFRKTGEKNGR